MMLTCQKRTKLFFFRCMYWINVIHIFTWYKEKNRLYGVLLFVRTMIQQKTFRSLHHASVVWGSNAPEVRFRYSADVILTHLKIEMFLGLIKAVLSIEYLNYYQRDLHVRKWSTERYWVPSLFQLLFFILFDYC